MPRNIFLFSSERSRLRIHVCCPTLGPTFLQQMWNVTQNRELRNCSHLRPHGDQRCFDQKWSFFKTNTRKVPCFTPLAIIRWVGHFSPFSTARISTKTSKWGTCALRHRGRRGRESQYEACLGACLGGIAFCGQFLPFAFQSFRHRTAVFLNKVLHKSEVLVLVYVHVSCH